MMVSPEDQERVERIIKKFGSQARAAEAAGVKQTAVAWWKQNGRIPANRMKALLENASTFGVDLQPNDFFHIEPAE